LAMQKACSSGSSSNSSSISSVYQQQQMQPDSTVPCIGSTDLDHLHHASVQYSAGHGGTSLPPQQHHVALHQSDASASAWYANPYSSAGSYCYMPQQQQQQIQIHHQSLEEDIASNGFVAQQQQQQQQHQSVAASYPAAFSPPGSGKYFWQYNAQGKGPKLACQDRGLLQDDRDLSHSDERKVLGFQDPVLRMQAARSDKVRRGNANDIDPRPEELARLGRQLDELRAQMCHPTKLCDKTEKNKLASRACRLRKKAQHEAFKIKLAGLQAEHTSLVQVLKQGEALLLDPEATSVNPHSSAITMDNKNSSNSVSDSTTAATSTTTTPAGVLGSIGSFAAALDSLMSTHLCVARVAGRCDQYVLDELDRFSRNDSYQQQPGQPILLHSGEVSPDCATASSANRHLSAHQPATGPYKRSLHSTASVAAAGNAAGQFVALHQQQQQIVS
ncbi:hypothetical protein BOX15_Mlig027919g1, partial [Macrostomum lignano]